ncbi:glycosyltransferase [Marinomonas pontica]|uniref:glycosyltransferase n=1 Tax=Marinomonas pontica TaxID=264739 RepID=UPI002244A365|nr:glycosyltransferase [Marinomonas pontica]MCW8354661.1 glycosyltransferase [Marinomonas pontica]
MITMELPKVTVIIATYNSMHVLPRVLNAIDNQSYPKEKITVMLVDGGSTDETIDYGYERGCSIISNPRTELRHAKFLVL